MQRQLLASINQFQTHVKKATINAWWLYDDGGPTLLLPHSLTLRDSYLQGALVKRLLQWLLLIIGANLRVFTIASSKCELDREQRSVATLLAKFRIPSKSVFVIPDITRKPSAER